MVFLCGEYFGCRPAFTGEAAGGCQLFGGRRRPAKAAWESLGGQTRDGPGLDVHRASRRQTSGKMADDSGWSSYTDPSEIVDHSGAPVHCQKVHWQGGGPMSGHGVISECSCVNLGTGFPHCSVQRNIWGSVQFRFPRLSSWHSGSAFLCRLGRAGRAFTFPPTVVPLARCVLGTAGGVKCTGGGDRLGEMSHPISRQG